jgi:hypothetical protein
MTALQEGGIGSALALARLGEATAIKKFGSSLGEDVVKTMCAKAVTVSSSALTLFSKYGGAFNQAKYKVWGDSSETPDSSVLDMPTWEQLFGSTDTCACEDCRSVYSPSAYLVDTLEFLKTLSRTDDTSKTAFDLLDERRPTSGRASSFPQELGHGKSLTFRAEILESVVTSATALPWQLIRPPDRRRAWRQMMRYFLLTPQIPRRVLLFSLAAAVCS